MFTVPISQLENYIADVLTHLDMEEEQARITAHHMVFADSKGTDTHGIMQLPIYVDRIKDGGINNRPHMQWEKETGNSGVLNGDNGMGHYVVHKAMERAIELAQHNAISFVSVYNGSHFGAAASYTKMAADANMIGFITSNAAPLMAATGGVERVLGNNPLSFAVPRQDAYPVILDIACSNVAMGKLVLAQTKGESIPLGWALDKDGNPTTDPYEGFQGGGTLLPIAEHKGYGLALIMDILSGVLTGANYGKNVGRMADTKKPTGVGCSMIVIHIAQIMGTDQFFERMEDLLSMIGSSKKAEHADKIYLPGEKGNETALFRAESGIPIPEKLHERLTQIALELNMVPAQYGL
jgi:LDH2 family malate/lactate/ureidoglycolate dehydrogenase